MQIVVLENKKLLPQEIRKIRKILQFLAFSVLKNSDVSNVSLNTDALC